MKPVLSKLKLKRLLMCKTQQEVADNISISRSYLAAIENNRERMTGELLKKFTSYYNCQSTELI
ncbi:helix-turn-helix domain-containing protein [Pelosinus propionicus]|uniref:Helix-turn-helix n=1 Tax=Pelosinus propionicus DSM 13327 TaxID=1123291 RepID=A0A1I4JGJ4_9FIRM|nr:helix-turn-helix transcriptional regulator [Pelosinus propionicus]SFL65644.1 Helix-turn-helix [Pelosinus propionicus DSM 13327]SFM24496.1 Helix-turn-helix [Pelosinus propionicus DSM 13327]